MKRLVALVLLGILAVALLCLGASETLTNRTGKTVSGVVITFSESVRITSWDTAIFAGCSPSSGRAESFTFSGGELGPGSRFRLSWNPASAHVLTCQWSGPPASSGVTDEATGCCTAGYSAFGARPAVPGDVAQLLYGYLASPRDCQGSRPFTVPVYVSIPYATPPSARFSLEVAGGAEQGLIRIDEIDLVGSVRVEALPTSLSVRVLRDSQAVTPWLTIELENGYQAITVGIPDLPGVQLCSSLPADFLRGVGLWDIYGFYIYNDVRLKQFFEPTCQRAREDGFSDIYVTSTVMLSQALPRPRMVECRNSGADTIPEEDLQFLSSVAHRYGLRLHLIINLGSTESDYQYLLGGAKTAEWLQELLDEYARMAEEHAHAAARCGVDGLVVNWLSSWTSYSGHESLWWSLWQQLIHNLRGIFPALLQYAVTSPEELEAIATGQVSVRTFDGIDAFMIGPSPTMETLDDSVGAFFEGFAGWLETIHLLKTTVSRPVYLDISFQSTDGFFVAGWYDAAIGIIGNSNPDFFEQARAYEALLQQLARNGYADGIMSYKYHWDDAFGPDLWIDTVSRMDLEASVRNKPAEAVIKRWFGGVAGPATGIGKTLATAMNRPWCPASSPYEVPTSQKEACVRMVDDFQGGASFRDLAWVVDYDSAHRITPSQDPGAYCHITFPTDNTGDTYLNGDFAHNSWMKVRYWGPTIDASGYEGIQLEVWADRTTVFDLELAAMDPDAGWKVGLMGSIRIDASPRVFRIPFDALVNPELGKTGAFVPYLEHFMAIGLFMAAGEGAIRIDDICFYGAASSGEP